jgi:DNA mismatch repair protein MLH1
MKVPSDEFQKIFDVIAKYAVHNFKISFGLKKHGENNSIKTISSCSPVEIIRGIYGNNVANSLLDVDCSDERLKFTMTGFITKGDYSGKKRHFLLFINHRLVESKSLKKAIFDELYHALLPNNVQPFVYMSIEMDPKNLDVNVSPTKHEVNFLNEDSIVEKIKEAIEERLLGTTETKKLYTQQLLPGASEITSNKSFDDKDKIYAKDMVRTDSKVQTIVKFLNDERRESTETSQTLNTSHIVKSPAGIRSKPDSQPSLLTSINELKSEILDSSDEGLREQVDKLKFVGIASRSKALVQCENVLYLCDTEKLSSELFYQQSVMNFENYESFEFEFPLKISKLASIGFDMKECAWEEADGPKDHLAQQVEIVLMDNRDLLREYFGITINEAGELETLPIIVRSYVPLMSHLPLFLIRLACEVDYDNEKECFTSIFKELAFYYSRFSLTASEADFHYLAETVIYPEIRKSLNPPARFLSDSTFLKLTSLQELYKVFERC